MPLLARFSRLPEAEVVGDADGEGWTPQAADELVGRITTDARRALKYIAENAPEVRFEALQGHLGMEGLQVGGVMASFGFAERAGYPRPYRVDRRRRRYVIDADVAPIILDAVDRYAES